MRVFLVILLSVALTGCGSYELKNLAKSDIDLVADEFIVETRSAVRELVVKLYARNPDQLRKNPGMTVEGRLAQLRVHLQMQQKGVRSKRWCLARARSSPRCAGVY